MKYITDYQLDIKRGFQCKVNEKRFDIFFSELSNGKEWFLSHQFFQLLIELKLNPDSVVKSYGRHSKHNLVYCDSVQQCYDLCQHIVEKYFKPIDISKKIKECSEKSRKHLLKYYDGKRVSICNHTFILKNILSDVYWQLDEIFSSSLLYTQFSLTDIDVEKICKSLNIHITWYQLILAFSNSQDAIKFTDYLIETYIIKKEKTYDTNQLRKKRTSVSRGFEPAGSIIHGRRSKASIRCRHIEHKARIGC